MKIAKKFLLIVIVVAVILTVLNFSWLVPNYTVPILMYHRLGYQDNTLFVTPENFNAQMEYIRKKGYDVISLDKLIEGIENNKNFNRDTVVITIDDGYKDNFDYAYPILQKYNFPATIFVIPNSINREEDFMSWDDVKIMSRNKISIGAHTMNHVYLPSIMDRSVLVNEIKGCKEFIEDKIDDDVDFFCYPTGGFTDEAKIIVKESGYKGACTTNRGFIELNKDVYELKRVKVTNSDMNKPFSFWAKLSGYYNFFRSKKKGY